MPQSDRFKELTQQLFSIDAMDFDPTLLDEYLQLASKQEFYHEPDFNAERALHDFRKTYDLPDIPQKTQRFYSRRILHIFFAATLMICILSAMLIQAFGDRTLRVKGVWNDNIFRLEPINGEKNSHIGDTEAIFDEDGTLLWEAEPGASEKFLPSAEEENDDFYIVVTEVTEAPSLDANGCFSFSDFLKKYHEPVALIPRWLPDGFTLDNLDGYDDEKDTTFYSAFYRTPAGRYLSIDIRKYYGHYCVNNYFKDSRPVTTYPVGENTFYIFHNGDILIAAGMCDQYEVSIQGHLTKVEMKQILDSIKY